MEKSIADSETLSIQGEQMLAHGAMPATAIRGLRQQLEIDPSSRRADPQRALGGYHWWPARRSYTARRILAGRFSYMLFAC
ncbi:hypothetical protein ACWPM1_11850 [Tsuneonella sp. HG249]